MKIGDNVLITTDNWFFAPDGESYRAVWGTVHKVATAEDTLGVRPNGRSTNWYIHIGNMIVAGCQIHYAIQCDNEPSKTPPTVENVHEGKTTFEKAAYSRIYNANN